LRASTRQSPFRSCCSSSSPRSWARLSDRGARYRHPSSGDQSCAELLSAQQPVLEAARALKRPRHGYSLSTSRRTSAPPSSLPRPCWNGDPGEASLIP
jgi:hypothetical protein